MNYLRNYCNVVFVKPFVMRKVGMCYVPIDGGGVKKIYEADLALEVLKDGTYKVVKDRYRDSIGKILTEDEVFLEVL